MRICIIDDNALLAEALAFSLRDQGHDVLLAADGASGLRAVHDIEPDAVVVDWQMPGMRGDAVALKARELCPDAAIFLVSGGTARESFNAMETMRQAEIRYLDKPFTPIQLLAAISLERNAPNGFRGGGAP